MWPRGSLSVSQKYSQSRTLQTNRTQQMLSTRRAYFNEGNARIALDFRRKNRGDSARKSLDCAGADALYHVETEAHPSQIFRIARVFERPVQILHERRNHERIESRDVGV